MNDISTQELETRLQRMVGTLAEMVEGIQLFHELNELVLATLINHQDEFRIHRDNIEYVEKHFNPFKDIQLPDSLPRTS